MLSDIEIAQATEPKHISDVAKIAGIPEEYIEQYGKYKAKIDLKFLEKSKKKNGKLILVTAMTPTPAGEGKTTTTIGLADGLRKIGKKSIVALREPSLGPVFGVKGGACGGGYAQVIPMEDINLHFTGIFTPSAPRTTCWRQCWTIILNREMSLVSIHKKLLGNGALI